MVKFETHGQTRNSCSNSIIIVFLHSARTKREEKNVSMDEINESFLKEKCTSFGA
jgi:hypothetical protein